MLTLADDTVLKKVDVWVPENEVPEEATRRLERRGSSDGGMEKTGHYADEVTAALGAFLKQDAVRPYLSMPHYLFIVSPDATTGNLNISTVYFESEDQVTHNQLHRTAVTAASGAPWPRWPGPRSRVKMTANATWIFLHIIPVLLLLWLRRLCGGKPDHMLIPSFWLLMLCEWLILMDRNTKLFFDVPLEDPQEDKWYCLYFVQWALAISLGPSFFRWLDGCTGGSLKTHLRQHGPGIAMAAGLAAAMASVRVRRPSTPRGRIVSDPAFTADVERMRARARARGRVDVPVYSVALPLDPRPAAAVVPAPVGEEEQGAPGRARRTVRAVS
jgi:hypothetical protein